MHHIRASISRHLYVLRVQASTTLGLFSLDVPVPRSSILSPSRSAGFRHRRVSRVLRDASIRTRLLRGLSASSLPITRALNEATRAQIRLPRPPCVLRARRARFFGDVMGMLMESEVPTYLIHPGGAAYFYRDLPPEHRRRTSIMRMAWISRCRAHNRTAYRAHGSSPFCTMRHPRRIGARSLRLAGVYYKRIGWDAGSSQYYLVITAPYQLTHEEARTHPHPRRSAQDHMEVPIGVCSFESCRITKAPGRYHDGISYMLGFE